MINEGKIRGIVGYNEEIITFKKSIQRTILWQDLRYLEEEMSRVVTWELNLMENKNQVYTFGKIAKLVCEQTYLIQDAFAKRLPLGTLLQKV